MRVSHTVGLVSALFLIGALPVVSIAVSGPASAPQGADATAAVRAYTEAFDTPGIAAALVTGAGTETVLSGRDGAGAAITSRTPFRVASMSTSMTATAVMLLVQDGALALDEPVVDVLPEFTMADPRHEAITVRQLLSHTSGLSLGTVDEFTLPAHGTAREVVAELRNRRLTADSGTTVEYHDTNFSLAARIIEVISGESLAEFLESRLFRPLGMADTESVDRCDGRVDHLTEGYSVVLGVSYVMPEMPGQCGGSSGVVSTLDDMLRWIDFNQGEIGADVLDAELLSELHQAQPAAGSSALGWESRGASEGHPRALIARGGTLATFAAAMVFVPDTGAAAVVLTNGPGAPDELARNLIAGAEGAIQTPYLNALDVVNAILLGLTLVALVLLAITIGRGPRWAVRRRAARRPRVLLRMLPLCLAIVLGLFVPLTPAMPRAIDGKYWVTDLWFFPLLDVLGLVLVLGGISAIVSRVVALRVVPAALRRRMRGRP
ncbi:serine hydrolase domain-containing protein [Microbacterium sp. PMB16]|uniref:serine hydrolase domain-containing protein n=1 Tax=Microbacterium sp. PMB16 TaxID=3120157 RepID=UPI003F4C674F